MSFLQHGARLDAEILDQTAAGSLVHGQGLRLLAGRGE